MAVNLTSGKMQKSKMADPTWSPFGNADVITITLKEVKIFGRTLLSSKNNCHRSNSFGLMEGGGGGFGGAQKIGVKLRSVLVRWSADLFINNKRQCFHQSFHLTNDKLSCGGK